MTGTRMVRRLRVAQRRWGQGAGRPPREAVVPCRRLCQMRQPPSDERFRIAIEPLLMLKRRERVDAFVIFGRPGRLLRVDVFCR